MTRAVTRVVLTTGGPAYHYRYDGRRLVVRAGAGSVDSNRREAGRARGDRARRDQVSCATWARRAAGGCSRGSRSGWLTGAAGCGR